MLRVQNAVATLWVSRAAVRQQVLLPRKDDPHAEAQVLRRCGFKRVGDAAVAPKLCGLSVHCLHLAVPCALAVGHAVNKRVCTLANVPDTFAPISSLHHVVRPCPRHLIGVDAPRLGGARFPDAPSRQENARKIAAVLREHPLVKRVYTPRHALSFDRDGTGR